MSKIEKIVKRNRSLFDDMVPREGHEERFAARLSELPESGSPHRVADPRKPRRRGLVASLSLMSLTAAAALLTLVLDFGKDGCVDRQICDIVSYYSMQLESEGQRLLDAAQTRGGDLRQRVEGKIGSIAGASLYDKSLSNLPRQDQIKAIYQKYEAYSRSLSVMEEVITENQQ